MNFLKGKKAARGLALALALGVGLAACNEDREDLTQPVGDFLFNFLVDQSLTGGMPGGSHAIDAFSIAGVDLSPEDAFGRAGGGQAAGYGEVPFGSGWSATGKIRNASTDPRLPAIVDDDATVIPDSDGFTVSVLDPSGLCGSPCQLHNPFSTGTITGLKPNTQYIVAFFRYGLEVNGDLDVGNVILDETVSQPDRLVTVGGAPAGDPTIRIESFPTFSAPLTADANPFVLGFFETDASGEGGFDVIVDGSSNDVLYGDNSGDPSPAAFDSALVARNDDTPTTFPRYNYIVFLEGPATTAADAADNPQALRIQMAQDFAVGGSEMANNAHAPFPTEAFTTSELLAESCCAGGPREITFTFSNLAPLSGGVYQFWLMNNETGDMISPAGNWTATMDGEQVGSGSGVKSFNSDNGWSHTFTTSDAMAGQPLTDFTHGFVTIESSEASSPSARQPLWTQFTDMAGAPDDAFQWTLINEDAATFGTFNGGESPVAWAPRGQGRAAFWGDARGETNELRVRFRNLQIPPRGYFYEGWLLAADGPAPANLGPLTTEFEEGFESLKNADQDPTLSTNIAPEANLIVISAQRAFEEELGVEFPNFDEYRVTLTPKMGDGTPPPTTTLGTTVPEPVTARRQTDEEGGDGGDGGGS